MSTETGLPYSYNNSIEAASLPTSVSSCTSEPPQEDSVGEEKSHTALRSAFDLQLLQHFTLDVSRTLAEESKDITLWQRMVPMIAFEYAFVMHGVLAVSALSFARQSMSTKAKSLAAAEVHHARILPAFIHELSNPNEANIDALYVASVLLSFHHFAKGPQAGEYLIFGDRSQPEWLWLLGGVRAMLDRRGRKPLEDLDTIHSDYQHFPAELLLQNVRVPPLDATNTLKHLRQLIANSPDSFVTAVDNLEMCFTRAFVDDGHPTGVRPRNHLIMAWLYLLESDFLTAAQAKQPIALIIIAYYATLLHKLNHCWLMYDWGLHLMDGVNRHLPEEYKLWLQWPATAMNWQPPV